jgi:hypothetical protein
MVRLMGRQRLVNVFVSNVPGPKAPLFFHGACVREVFQFGLIQGNVRLGVGILSYANRIGIDVVADAEALPDLDVFVDGFARALREIGVSTPQPTPRRAAV